MFAEHNRKFLRPRNATAYSVKIKNYWRNFVTEIAQRWPNKFSSAVNEIKILVKLYKIIKLNSDFSDDEIN